MLYSEIMEYRAANLPVGSVVANSRTAWIKTRHHGYGPWRSTYGSTLTNSQMDDELAGGPGGFDLAVVLRVGTGEVVS